MVINMTDTTDIKALWKLAAEVTKRLSETLTACNRRGYCDEALNNMKDALELAISTAETERQRSADLVLHVNTQANMREKAEAELSALKGEQVPVGKFVFEPSGERWHHIKHGEHQHAEPKLKLVKLFTAPQKPVVLRPHLHPSHSYASVAVSGRDEQWYAAIEAAGGTVKDGE